MKILVSCSGGDGVVVGDDGGRDGGGGCGSGCRNVQFRRINGEMNSLLNLCLFFSFPLSFIFS